MYLSLVIPFYNRNVESLKLLKTLNKLELKGVEVILVDDGSTDDTYIKLTKFKDCFVGQSIQLIKQDNKGPGGARNAGLKVSKGKYVWFVDSDDNITQEAIDFIVDNNSTNHDLINFNYLRQGMVKSGVSVNPGSYTNEQEVRKILLGGFGPLWSNVYKRKVLTDNNILYPEYCYYEDNPLAFIYPFIIKSLLNSNVIAYEYNEDNESIVRSKPNLRTLDRLYTAEYGFDKGMQYSVGQSERVVLERMFNRLYLVNSVGMFATKKPSKQWLVVWRIMKSYREKAKELDIKDQVNVLNVLTMEGTSSKYRAFFFVHWLLSYGLIKNQGKFFKDVRAKAWS